MSTHDRGVVISDSGYVHEPDNLFDARFPDFHATRLSAVAGLRLLHYARVTGYDALLARRTFRSACHSRGRSGAGFRISATRTGCSAATCSADTHSDHRFWERACRARSSAMRRPVDGRDS